MRNFLYLLSTCLLFAIGCSDEEELTLLSPSLDQEVDHCCFTFDWVPYKSETEYNFLLSKDASFSDIIVETNISIESYQLDRGIRPNQVYFWKVTALSDSKSATSSFKVRDYGQFYQGMYKANRRHVENVQGQIVYDLTTEVEIQLNSTEVEGHILILGDLYHYDIDSEDINCISFFDEPSFSGCLFPQQDSIYIEYKVFSEFGYEKITTVAKLQQ